MLESVHVNPLDGDVSFYEHKALSSTKVKNETRANTVRNDLKKHADEQPVALDLMI
jgi:hypothetical protein